MIIFRYLITIYHSIFSQDCLKKSPPFSKKILIFQPVKISPGTPGVVIFRFFPQEHKHVFGKVFLTVVKPVGEPFKMLLQIKIPAVKIGVLEFTVGKVFFTAVTVFHKMFPGQAIQFLVKLRDGFAGGVDLQEIKRPWVLQIKSFVFRLFMCYHVRDIGFHNAQIGFDHDEICRRKYFLVAGFIRDHHSHLHFHHHLPHPH